MKYPEICKSNSICPRCEHLDLLTENQNVVCCYDEELSDEELLNKTKCEHYRNLEETECAFCRSFSYSPETRYCPSEMSCLSNHDDFLLTKYGCMLGVD